MFNFNDAGTMSQQSLDTMMKSFSAVATGMQAIASETADYSRKSFDQGSKAAEQLSAAKSFEKVFEIQADYAKTSYETFVAQTTRIGEVYADLARDAYRPFANTAA